MKSKQIENTDTIKSTENLQINRLHTKYKHKKTEKLLIES